MENAKQKIDIYEVTIENVPVTVKNITTYRSISQPRRRYVFDYSCQIFLDKLKILDLPRHWRPGEYLKEIQWLTDRNKVIKFYQLDCTKQFEFYCNNPIEFLLQNNFIVHLMQDPCCFDHATMEECFADFRIAYNAFHQQILQRKEFLFPIDLEQIWKKSWKTEYYPSEADLIKSRFLSLPYLST